MTSIFLLGTLFARADVFWKQILNDKNMIYNFQNTNTELPFLI